MYGLGPIEIAIILIIFVVGFIGSIIWIWALIDCAKNEPSDGNDKLIWILIILFTHFIGAILYLLIRRPVRKSNL